MKTILLIAPMASVHEGFNSPCIEALADLQVELHLAANFSMDEHAKEYGRNLQRQGYIVHDIPFVRSSLFSNLQCISVLKKLLVEENFELVHVHTETGGMLIRFAMCANMNTKYIYTPHGMSFWKGSPLKTQLVYRPVERWICSNMVNNIAINREEYAVLQKWNEKTARFIHGVGVDIEKYQHKIENKAEKKKSLGIPEDAKVLLSVGELNGNKNHKIIIDALSKIDISSKNLYYLVCGADQNNGFLTDYVRQNNLSDRVVLAGYRRDMHEIYPIADYLAFPSYHEGLPVSVMEAMANGLPILASKIRGVIDLIDDGKGGFLYAPTDAEGFTSGIQTLLDDEKLCADMGEINRNKVRMYDVSKVRQEMYNLYCQLLDYKI